MRRLNLQCSVALACAVLASACGKKEAPHAAAKPRAVEVLTLTAKPIRTTGEYLGSLLSRGSVSVLPQVAGYIRAIHVRPGMSVAAGAALVEIDARDENAALNSASAQAESAETQRQLAETMLKRAESLYKEGLATAQEIDQRRADLAAATAAVRVAGATIAQRRVALSNRTIRAAIPGVVGDVNVRIGDYVQATTQLTSLARAESLELSVSVPAVRARALAVGAPLEVLAEDGSVLVASQISYLAPEADPRTQLVEVKATFDNSVRLRPSELVRVRIVYSTDTVLQVPLLAVQRQAGKAFAYVVVPKGPGLAVERRLIQIGALRQDGYTVTGGLAEGDRIAVSSLMQLKDGAAITIAPPKVEKADAGGKARPEKADKSESATAPAKADPGTVRSAAPAAAPAAAAPAPAATPATPGPKQGG